jgi:peptidoglycan/xylan/chitin deacetylase (PgdA/CDA1 family)
MRRHDPRDNPGTVLAAVTFGLLAFLAPAPTGPAWAPAGPGRAVPAAAPAPAALPVQKVVTITAAPVVLKSSGALRGDPTISLTFDDGPDPTWTPRVLDVLRRNAAVATFCVVGQQAREHPQLLRDIVAAGMRLCNHTRTHPADLTVAPEPAQWQEIVGARAELRALVDAPVAYFRAPGGHFSPPVLEMAAAQGMQPLGWSIDLRDWEQPGRLRILTTLEHNLRPGAVILMHDGGGNRAQTVESLELMLPWLRESGYRFTFPTP